MHIRGIDVDDVHGFVYWAADNKNIKQATLNGSIKKVVVSDTGKLNVISLQIMYVQLRLFELFALFVFDDSICTIDISKNNRMLHWM